jgi:hypothetical protein
MSAQSQASIAGLQYPSRLRRIVPATWITLLVLNLGEYALAWMRALYALVLVPLGLPYLAFLDPQQNPLAILLTAHLGLFVALIAARALALLTPKISLWGKGILFESRLGKRFIEFEKIRALYSIEFKTNGRFLVWVDAAPGLPLQNFLALLIFGKWFGGGFWLTSDLAGFDQIIATIVARMKTQLGEKDFAARFHEDGPSWLLKMIFAPRATIADTVSLYVIPLTQRDAAMQAATASIALALPLAIAALIHLQMPWGALTLPLFAFFEFPLAALFLAAIPMESHRRMEFDDAWRVYPLTQLPRWIIAFAFTALVIAGAPLFVFLLALAPALALGCYWVIQLTKAWFELSFSNALLGAIFSAIYQALLYAAFIALLAR